MNYLHANFNCVTNDELHPRVKTECLALKDNTVCDLYKLVLKQTQQSSKFNISFIKNFFKNSLLNIFYIEKLDGAVCVKNLFFKIFESI